MLREIQKLTSLKIMNENFKTISYSITFLSDMYPTEENQVISFSDQVGNIFKDIASVFALQLVLESYDKHSESEIIENTKSLFTVREFETKDGSLKFVFEQPFKLTIQYNADKGKKENPDEYVKGLASLIAVKSGKKSKIGSLGINYEVFYPMKDPEKIIINNLISQVDKDEDLESGLVKLVYKIDLFTKLNLTITSAKHKEEKGLYLNTNFHSEIKGDNKISNVLSREDLREILNTKIAKLIKIS